MNEENEENIEKTGIALELVLQLLPKEVRKFIFDNYRLVFLPMSDSPDRYDTAMIGSGVIYVNDTLWKAEQIKIAVTVAHEVAHAFTGNVEGGSFFEKYETEEHRKKDIEMDKLAVEWLSEYYDKPKLIKACYYWKP